MRKIILAATMLAGAAPYAAQAQSVPNYGNYTALDDNYRIGIRLTNTAGTREAAFEQTTIEDIIDYLDPAELLAAQPNFYTNQTAVQGVFDLVGAPVLAGYAANSSVLTVNFIDPATGQTVNGKDGLPCFFSYNGASRAASFAQLDSDSDPDVNPNSRILACATLAGGRYSPVNPLVGNPQSLQADMTRAALDFTEGDSLVELGDNANSAGDPLQIGAVFSTGSAGRFDVTRIDARINKGWRVFEGNRARLKVDLPFSYTRVNGASAYNGQIGLGLEVPVSGNSWSLEPRVSYGITYSGDQGSLGHIIQGSIASRYVIRGLGRGQLLIGNMVGYSATLGTPTDFDINPDVKAWSFRNGLAYEMPLSARIGGRSTSVRASYAWTKYTGAKLYNDNFHEATLSFGIRGREDTPKAFRDTVRLNFSAILARGFHTYTAGLGFRF